MVDDGACDGPDARQLCDDAELSFAATPLNHHAGLALPYLQNSPKAPRFGPGNFLGRAAWQLPSLRYIYRQAICHDRNFDGMHIDHGFHHLWLHVLATVAAGSERDVDYGARRLAGAFLQHVRLTLIRDSMFCLKSAPLTAACFENANRHGKLPIIQWEQGRWFRAYKVFGPIGTSARTFFSKRFFMTGIKAGSPEP